MALRSVCGWLAVAAITVGAGASCKDKATGEGAGAAGGADLAQRCEQLAKTCGDQAKHVETITGECKQAATAQAAKGCAAKAIAVYACYEQELCGKADKVWALDDLRVLAERQSKCVAERDAARACEQP